VDLILKHHAYSSYLPSRIKVCDRLIDTLWALWNETLDQMALKACIEIEIELRFLLSPSGPGRDRHSARLAASIVPRPSQNYSIKLRDEAVRLGKEVIALQPSDHPKRHISCHNLAALLYERYCQTGDRILLEDAIHFNRQALALRPPSHPSRSHLCGSLAMFLLECFSYTGDAAMLKESVQLNEEALELRHVGHPDRHISCSNLAASLRVYFTVRGDENSLDRAIELSRKVLHLRPVGHQDRYLACSNLATLLHHSYELTWSVSLLDEAIELHKQALSLQPGGSSSQAGTSEQDMVHSWMRSYNSTEKRLLFDLNLTSVGISHVAPWPTHFTIDSVRQGMAKFCTKPCSSTGKHFLCDRWVIQTGPSRATASHPYFSVATGKRETPKS
jgi:tetratricopeptide (TPR) repeat protein